MGKGQTVGPVGPTRYGSAGTLVVAGWYGNGRLALSVTNPVSGVLYKATVNMPDDELADGFVFLKGWSENEGVPEALELAGHVRLTGREVQAGLSTAVEAEILFKLDEEG